MVSTLPELGVDVPPTLPALLPKSPQQAVGHIPVILSPEDEAYGRYCGDVRQGWNASRRNRDKNERIGKRSSQEVHQHGALAEVAVCRAYGLPLSLVRLDGRFTDPDLGDTDVKGTWNDNGHLLVEAPGRKAPPNRPHVLAVGDKDRWRIAGWVWNWQAQEERFATDRFGNYSYAVPQRCLIDPAWLQIRWR